MAPSLYVAIVAIGVGRRQTEGVDHAISAGQEIVGFQRLLRGNKGGTCLGVDVLLLSRRRVLRMPRWRPAHQRVELLRQMVNLAASSAAALLQGADPANCPPQETVAMRLQGCEASGRTFGHRHCHNSELCGYVLAPAPQGPRGKR